MFRDLKEYWGTVIVDMAKDRQFFGSCQANIWAEINTTNYRLGRWILGHNKILALLTWADALYTLGKIIDCYFFSHKFVETGFDYDGGFDIGCTHCGYTFSGRF